MDSNTNLLFDRPKLTLTCFEPIDATNFDEVVGRVEEQIKYVVTRFKQGKLENNLPFDKEKIILPRQQTFIQKVKESKFEKKKKNRMIWDEKTKGWILRRQKQKTLNVPPIIEATKQDAYEDVFRKKEMEFELKKAQKQLRQDKKEKLKNLKMKQVRKQL